MESTTEENQRVERAREGDRMAMGELLVEYHPRLLRHLAARMPPSAARVFAPEDIAQQAYACAFRELGGFEYRGDGSFFAWLRTIAERQLLNTLKKLHALKRGGDAGHQSLVRESQSLGEIIDIVAGEGDAPSLHMRRQEAIDALYVALAELPADYQEVVRRRFLIGQSIEDTAQAMHRTPSAIRSVADRAKRRLRDTLMSLSLYLSRR